MTQKGLISWKNRRESVPEGWGQKESLTRSSSASQSWLRKFHSNAHDLSSRYPGRSQGPKTEGFKGDAYRHNVINRRGDEAII